MDKEQKTPWATSFGLHLLCFLGALVLLLGARAAVRGLTEEKAVRMDITSGFNIEEPNLLGDYKPGTSLGDEMLGGGSPKPEFMPMGPVSHGPSLTGERADLIAAGLGAMTGQAAPGPVTSKDGTGNGFFGVGTGFTNGDGSGGGPRGGGYARRVVYILDTSGSMMDNFDFVRVECKRAVGSMIPLQSAAVISLGETSTVVVPMTRVTTETKREINARVEVMAARGQNDDQLEPFETAFRLAFVYKPDLIYFLTDGHFDGRLLGRVKAMNAGSARIVTLAFVKHEPEYEKDLKQMAAENNGMFKFIAERDLK